jgi:opacity protein-like surface antigen
MKSILLALVISSLPLTAFEGFYVGGGVGGHLTEGEQTGSLAGANSGVPGRAPVIAFDTTQLQKKMFDHGAAGMLYAGYGRGWGSFHLAAEGFIQLGYAKLPNTQKNIELEASTADLELYTIPTNATACLHCCQGGIDLLPGWSPNHLILLYGRIGVGVARTSLSVKGSFFGVAEDDSWELPFSLSHDKTSASWRIGGGWESPLTNRLSLRADYIYTDLGKQSVQGAFATTSVEGATVTTNLTDRVHLYDHALLLGLSYRFCNPWTLDCSRWCKACAYSGIYIGGAIGGGALEAHQSGDTYGMQIIRSVTQQVAGAPSQLYNNQFQGVVFLGYGWERHRLYLGGELFATADSHTSMDCTGKVQISFPTLDTVYTTSYDTSIQSSTWQYGFDLRPGVLLNPLTLLYGRVGVSAAQIKANSDALFAENAENWSLPESVSASMWKAIFRVGAGLEYLLTSRLHLRADYVFTNYGIVSFNDEVTGVDIDGDSVTLTNTLSSHLQSNSLVVGLSYYFH